MKVTVKDISATRNANTLHYICTRNNSRHTGYTIFAPTGSDAAATTLVCSCNHQRQHLSECLHRQAACELLRAEAMVADEGLTVCGDAYRDENDALFFAL